MSKALNRTGQLCVAFIDQFSMAVFIVKYWFRSELKWY